MFRPGGNETACCSYGRRIGKAPSQRARRSTACVARASCVGVGVGCGCMDVYACVRASTQAQTRPWGATGSEEEKKCCPGGRQQVAGWTRHRSPVRASGQGMGLPTPRRKWVRSLLDCWAQQPSPLRDTTSQTHPYRHTHTTRGEARLLDRGKDVEEGK